MSGIGRGGRGALLREAMAAPMRRPGEQVHFIMLTLPTLIVR